jgi:hypothetical protein
MIKTLSSTNQDSTLTDDLEYDQRIKRFRYKDSGKFASREETINLQKKYLEQQIEKFISLAPRIKAGDITAYMQLGETLKRIHLSNAIIAANGYDNLTQRDLGQIGAILKKQYYAGYDPITNQKFGLKFLIEESKDQSETMIANRLKMFAKSGELSGTIVKANKMLDQGYDIERRILGQTHKHCKECIEYASRGWQPINSLPKPKTMCSCRSNCVCRLEYGKKSEIE